MKILDYTIPTELQNYDFLLSLKRQEESGKTFSKKQILSLRNVLEIEDDIFSLDFECPASMYEFQKDFETLKNKLTRNKFKKVSSKNKHFYCFMSIVNEEPDRNMIKDLLHFNYVDSLRR